MKKYLISLIIIFISTSAFAKPMVFNKQTVPSQLKKFENSILFKLYEKFNEIIPQTFFYREIKNTPFSYGLIIEKFHPFLIINAKF